MTFDEEKVQFSINQYFIDKSKKKYSFTEDEQKKIVSDLAKGLKYRKLKLC